MIINENNLEKNFLLFKNKIYKNQNNPNFYLYFLYLLIIFFIIFIMNYNRGKYYKKSQINIFKNKTLELYNKNIIINNNYFCKLII